MTYTLSSFPGSKMWEGKLPVLRHTYTVYQSLALNRDLFYFKLQALN